MAKPEIEYHFLGRVLAGLLAAGVVWVLAMRARTGDFSWPTVGGAILLFVLLVYALAGPRVLHRMFPQMLKHVSTVEIWLLLLVGVVLIGMVIAMAVVMRQVG